MLFMLVWFFFLKGGGEKDSFPMALSSLGHICRRVRHANHPRVLVCSDLEPARGSLGGNGNLPSVPFRTDVTHKSLL